MEDNIQNCLPTVMFCETPCRFQGGGVSSVPVWKMCISLCQGDVASFISPLFPILFELVPFELFPFELFPFELFPFELVNHCIHRE